jgi:secreted trypsin-like serine protease
LKRTRLAVVALLAIVLPSLSQAADARPVRPGADIIGGTPAGTGEFPFMAAILDETRGGNDFNKQFCGGSLISASWVLTAAHCAEGMSADDLAVAVGRTLLNSTQGERHDVANVYMHPRFNIPVGLAHDAALLRLTTPVTSPTITPIRLAAEPPAADDQFEAAGTMLTVIGWGTVSTRKPSYPNDLRKVDVPVVSDTTCRGAYGASLDAATMVCAGAPNIDSCYGDSGGPLFAKNGGSPVQVGIVSWGNGCAKRRFPGVYSEVNNQQIRDFIRSTAGV